MLPKTLLAPNKLIQLLAKGNAFPKLVQQWNEQLGLVIPVLPVSQIVLSASDPELSDRNEGMSYPRICVHTAELRSTQAEKFCSFSGSVTVAADIWASSDLVQMADTSVHYYVEGLTTILNQAIGDWGDGVYFSGVYDVKLQQPRIGGLGFVSSARVLWAFNITQN